MEIPARITVGSRLYVINKRKRPRKRFTVGEVNYTKQRIDIITHSNFTGRAFKSEELSDTFWHELTHAILHDMDHPLTRDEKFVTAFARRLNDAIISAEF